jgi:phage shock protein PspC (stress-responsive transcriptional regulator)
MESAEMSPQEKLDQMLDDGSVTEEDYRRLSAAMADKPQMTDEGGQRGSGRGKLKKSWDHRVVSGVCAGIGDHLGIDPIIVRVIAVTMAIMALPVMLIVYFVLCLILPWDDEEAARDLQRDSRPLRFALQALMLLTVIPFAYSVFVMPEWTRIYEDVDRVLPISTILVINIGNLYYSLAGLVVSLFIVGLATMGYLAFANSRSRTIYTFVLLIFAYSWTAFIVLGGLLPIVTHDFSPR